jgi:hypothetical protein
MLNINHASQHCRKIFSYTYNEIQELLYQLPYKLKIEQTLEFKQKKRRVPEPLSLLTFFLTMFPFQISIYSLIIRFSTNVIYIHRRPPRQTHPDKNTHEYPPPTRRVKS